MLEERFSLLKQTKMVTASSELARNAVIHGGGGVARLDKVEDGERLGMRLTVEDHGPGIANLKQALSGGYSNGNGLGLGLSGSKQLVDQFDLVSEPGKGTCVTITMWR
jgi:serine/threonine-protein kinase RsbT